MSLFRSNIKKLFSVNNTIIDDFIVLKHKFQISSDKNIDNTGSIKIQNLQNENKNKTIENILFMTNNDGYIHKKVMSKCSEDLKRNIFENTYFTNAFEFWNITNFVRKYNIDSKEIFLELTEKEEKYENYWNTCQIRNNYKHFDYCGVYGIKNGFPIDIYKSDFILNMRRYVDRSGIKGYNNLITLFEEKIKTANDITTKIDNNTNNINDNTNNDDINKIENNHKSSITIPSMDLEGKSTNYFNHNFLKISEDNFKFQLELDENKELYNFIQKGIENNTFDLEKYFEYNKKDSFCYEEDEEDEEEETDLVNSGKYILTPIRDTTMENLSIVNCIIFGKSNIRLIDVQKLLSLIRFEDGYSSYTLDNFKIIYYHRRSLNTNSDSEKINKMEFCKYQDMIECAKWLVQIMNEINPNELNKHNYQIIVQYCKLKDQYDEKLFNNLISNEKYRINSQTFPST
jgi:hypothetical protein